MRVVVMGAGALGSVFGGFLRKSGHDVALVGRDWHLRDINQHGLTIKGIWGDHQVKGFLLATDPGELSGQTFDAALITVKSQHTREAVEKVLPLLSPEGLVISLQNGLGNAETVAELAGPGRAGAGRVIFGAELTAPGEATVTVCADDVVIGKAVPKENKALDLRLQEMVEALRTAGIPTSWAEDVHQYLWAKTIYNSALNPLGALLGVNYGLLAEMEPTRQIMNQIIKEVFAVAKAKNINLPWGTPEEYTGLFYGRLVPVTAEHRASMLQDLEQGRKTEIDALNGRISEYGKILGVSTPVNDVIINLIKAREQQVLTPKE